MCRDQFRLRCSPTEVDALRTQFGLPRGILGVVSVSRLVRKNGLDDLIRAVRFLPRDMMLLLAGGGAAKRHLVSLANDLGVGSRVKFLGQIDHAEVRTLFEVAFCFVRPSLAEGLGNAVVEAMAASVPVVATRVGGLREFVVDGETAVACQPRSPSSIAKAILRLRDSPSLVQRVVVGGLKTASQFDIGRTAPAVDQLMRELLSSALI